MKKLLIFATFVYFLLAPITYHPDNKLVLNWASINNGTNWNIWNATADELKDVGQFNYPPVHFYLDKLQYFITKPIGGSGFYEWLSTPNSTDQNQDSLPRFTFAIKFPLMLFSLLAGYLLYLLAKQSKATEKQAIFVSALWLLNPITLYSIPVMGQNDVMAIVFFLAAWLFLNKKKLFYSALLFGLGASIKMFPLLWLPFLLLVEKRLSLKEKLVTFGSSVLVYIATLLPFISNPAFRAAVFERGIDRLFIARIDLGFEDKILIVPILLMLLVAGAVHKYKTIETKKVMIHQASILLLLNMIFLFFNHFHPQWFTWLLPFWALWFLNQKKENLVWVLLTNGIVLGAWALIILLFNDTALTAGLLTPLNAFLMTLPSMRELLLSQGVDVKTFNNYGHTLLAGMGILYFSYWFKSQEVSLRHSIGEFRYFWKKIPKLVLYISILAISFTSILMLTFIANAIPTPIASNNPVVVDYEPFVSTIEQTFIGQTNGLYRIDLYLSDIDLQNTDTYRVQMMSEDGTLVLDQVFSGINIGYKSEIRFDLRSQGNSMNQPYTIKLIPLEITEEDPLEIALTESDRLESFAFRSFYKKPRGNKYLGYVLTETLQQDFNILKQVPIVIIALPILLWLAL